MYYFEINGQKVMDPCAHAIMGRQVWNDCNRKKKHYEVYGAFAEENFNWGQDRHPEIPREQQRMLLQERLTLISLRHLNMRKQRKRF